MAITFPFQISLSNGTEITCQLYGPHWPALPGKAIAFDTETEMIVEGQVPRVAMMQVYDSEGSLFLIHPDDINDFMDKHMEHRFWCAHNVAFDFWVIFKHFIVTQRFDLVERWWRVVDENRMNDSMLADMLLRIARIDDHTGQRPLNLIADKYAELEIDKDDPFRERYAELFDIPKEKWPELDAGYFHYAAKDPVATMMAYREILRQTTTHHDCNPDPRWGPLTQNIQVKAALAIQVMQRNGVCVDRAAASGMQFAMKQISEETLTDIVDQAREFTTGKIFKTDKDGNYKYTKSGAISMNAKTFKEKVLTPLAEQNDTLNPPINADDLCTDSVSYWEQHTDVHPIIETYCTMKRNAKLLQFMEKLDADRIHPRYSVLVRTGRTSSSNPNLQQLPRQSKFRRLIKATPGYYLMAIDYSAIELRTLAQVCKVRYGKSVLADVFAQGGDPHTYTAKMLVSDWDDLTVEQQKSARQKAKAVNFGIPGGLGARSLTVYAKTAYGVDMTELEAKTIRDRLVNNIYPELKLYLTSTIFKDIAENIEASEEAVREAFRKESYATAAKRIVAGKQTKPDGKEYDPAFVANVWHNLYELTDNPYFKQCFSNKEGSEWLARKVFSGSVMTQTHRIRGHVSFTQQCNTPFQGLAADGAKLAMYRLMREGFRLVGFVHDEFLIEIPCDADLEQQTKQVEQILIEEMQQVVPDLPIKCEWLLADRWYKGVDSNQYTMDGRLIPYSEPLPSGKVDMDPASLNSFVAPPIKCPKCGKESQDAGDFDVIGVCKESNLFCPDCQCQFEEDGTEHVAGECCLERTPLEPVNQTAAEYVETVSKEPVVAITCSQCENAIHPDFKDACPFCELKKTKQMYDDLAEQHSALKLEANDQVPFDADPAPSDLAKVEIGIDPGKSGAIAVFNKADDKYEVFKMPETPADLAALLRTWSVEKAYVEDVNSHANDGHRQAFKFGFGSGAIAGVLAAFGIQTVYLRPIDWQKPLKLYGLKKKVDGKQVPLPDTEKKARHYSRAKELFPSVKFPKYACDAILILHQGMTAGSEPVADPEPAPEPEPTPDPEPVVNEPVTDPESTTDHVNCVSCNGTGKNSRGNNCRICKGLGHLKPQEAA